MAKDKGGHGSNAKGLHEKVCWLPPGTQAHHHVMVSAKSAFYRQAYRAGQISARELDSFNEAIA